ncbi:MAG TPA: tetratricopeptide repeat protein [Verrucomicrobiae bacterium]|nr:tetratricopeptide repeat protein [Verrucomicrobiae bacterium]
MRAILLASLLLSVTIVPARLEAQDSSSKGNPAPANVARQLSSPEAREALAKGQELLAEKHDAKGSVASFKRVVELEPRYARGYLLLGNACMQAQQWTDAQSAFEMAAHLEPDSATAFLGIGSALNQQKDWSGALKPLDQSLKLKADSAEAQYEMGRSLVGLGRLQDAELHIRMSIELNDKYALPHILMGDIYLHLYENADAALAEYQEYLRLDPDGPSAPPVKEMIATLQKLMS